MFAITRILIDEVRLLFSLNTVAFVTIGEYLRELQRKAEGVELPDFHPVYEPLIDFAEFVSLSTQVENPSDRPEQQPSSYG